MSRRRLPGMLWCAGILAAAAAIGRAGDDGPGRTFALRVGKVYTVSGPILDDATVLVRDGRIAEVGRDVKVPDGVPVIDAPRNVLIPGLIDAETALTGAQADVEKSVAPEVQALDAWDYFADRRSYLRGGVTTVYVIPGVSLASARSARLVSGRGAVVKLAGAAEDPLRRVLRPASGLQVTLGELSKRPPSIYEPPVAASPDNPFAVIPTQLPQSRPGELLALRRLLDDGRAAAAVADAGIASGGQPAVPIGLEAAAVSALVAGKDVLRVRANRARDILHVLELAREYGVRLVLEGGREADRLAPELAAAGVAVVFPASFQPGVIPEGDLSVETTEGRHREETLMALVRAGVRVAIHSPTDAEVDDLLDGAAAAIRAGLDPAAALRSITLTAAEVLGVDDRVGSIAPGKDADLVLLGGDPFTPAGKPQAVFIDGEVVHTDGPKDLGPEATVVRCASVWNGKGDQIPGGVIVVEAGKIRYVGAGPLVAHQSPRARVIDRSESVAVPGFIDTGTSAGARAEALLPPRAAIGGEAGGAGRAATRLADSIDPRDPELLELAAAGITTAAIAPGPIGPVSGQIAVWKLSGKAREEVEIKRYAALAIRGDLQAQDLRKAKEYHERWKAYEAKREGEAPDLRDEYEPFRAAFEKKVPVVVHLPNLEAAPGATRMLTQDFGLNVIAAGPGRADLVADSLRQMGIPVLLEVPLLHRDKGEKINVPRRLAEAGVRFAFRSGAGSGARGLVPQVALAAAEGASPASLLSALTRDAARILGVDDRVGTLEAGKDADIVFLSGEPFAPATRILGVMVGGELREKEAGR